MTDSDPEKGCGIASRGKPARHGRYITPQTRLQWGE
jgi:hypothetical protein